MKRQLVIAFILFFAFGLIPFNLAKAETLSNRLKGRILLQVEKNGEAWYVHPTSGERYYMANGDEAYNIMRDLGIGITNNNLEKMKTNKIFAKKNSGKIFLQVEANGEAYYVDFSGNLHYLKNGEEAYTIMREQGLGITNKNLEQIIIIDKNKNTSDEQIKQTVDAQNQTVQLDVCNNLDGVQSSLPTGMSRVDGNCYYKNNVQDSLTISGVQTTPSSDGVTIIWNTNLPAKSKVFIWTISSDKTFYESLFGTSTNHKVVVNNLKASTLYHFQIETIGLNGTFSSDSGTFSTNAEKVEVSNFLASNDSSDVGGKYTFSAISEDFNVKGLLISIPKQNSEHPIYWGDLRSIDNNNITYPMKSCSADDYYCNVRVNQPSRDYFFLNSIEVIIPANKSLIYTPAGMQRSQWFDNSIKNPLSQGIIEYVEAVGLQSGKSVVLVNLVGVN